MTATGRFDDPADSENLRLGGFLFARKLRPAAATEAAGAGRSGV